MEPVKADWRRELRAMIALAVPVVLSELGWMAMGVVDTIMVGRLGPAAIGAVALGNAFYYTPSIFGAGLLLGLDLVKDETVLLDAYDDAAGVTAAFNRNLLVRLNRELDADFDPESFAHGVRWNHAASRIEMHLVSRRRQRVGLAAIDLEVDFAAGESIHTENSYKYRPGQAEALLAQAGFHSASGWTDAQGWFAVYLGRAV